VSNDWRREVSLQVRAHRAGRRNGSPDSSQLHFEDRELWPANETSVAALRALNSRWDRNVSQSDSAKSEPVDVEQTGTAAPDESHIENQSQSSPAEQFEAVPEERLPLAPFPRIAAPRRKVIQFPRNQIITRQYELAEPVSDQLRIFEAVDELPPPAPTHLADIEIAPEEPVHVAGCELDLPLQTAPLSRRAFAAAVDGVLLAGALALFAECAQFFAGRIVFSKSLLASGSVCVFLLLGVYFFLSLTYSGSTAGMRVSGLWLSTFSGGTLSRNLLRWRAFATVLCYATLGLGFVWAFIDEDRLCWHDRITRTHLRCGEAISDKQ
jgi:uncharacterized RDD family membrane protein YckC